MIQNTNRCRYLFISFFFTIAFFLNLSFTTNIFASTMSMVNPEFEADFTKEAPVHANALKHLKQNHLDKAIELEKGHLEKDPDDLRSYLILALAYLGKGEEKTARIQASSLEKVHPHYAAEIYRSMGRYFFKKKRYYKADTYFNAALAIAPQDSTTLNLKASLYFAQGRVDKAKQYFERTLDSEPEYINLSSIYLIGNDYPNAIRLAKEAVKQYPDNTRAYILLGGAYLEADDLSHAEANFMKALQLDANPALVYYNLGLIHLAQKKYDDELKNFSRVKENKEAYINRAAIFHIKNDLDKAEKEAVSAIQIDPNDFLSHIVLGNIYISKGDNNLADKEYKLAGNLYYEFTFSGFSTRTVFNLTPSIQAEFTIANIFYRNGMLKRTIDVIKGVYSKPINPFLLMTEARSEAKIKHYDRAKKLYNKAIELNKNLITPYIALSDLAAKKGDYQKAIGFCEKAADIHPNMSGPYFSIGDYHIMAGNAEGAVKAYETGLKYAPKSAYALNQIAWILANEKQKLKPALSYALKAHSINPDDALICDTLGWIYYRLKRYNDAHNVYAGIRNDRAKDPMIFYHAGMVSQRLKRNNEAKIAFERALNLSDVFPEVEDARQRFETLSSM